MTRRNAAVWIVPVDALLEHHIAQQQAERVAEQGTAAPGLDAAERRALLEDAVAGR